MVMALPTFQNRPFSKMECTESQRDSTSDSGTVKEVTNRLEEKSRRKP